MKKLSFVFVFLLSTIHILVAKDRKFCEVKKECEIVVSFKNEIALNAAKDFQYHILKSTGQTIEMINGDKLYSANNKYKIWIGKSKEAENNVQFPVLKSEEVYISSNEKGVLLWGDDIANIPSTHYAVCEYLELIMGAKWLFPGEIGTIVIKNKCLILSEVNIRKVYQLRMREFYELNKTTKEEKIWLIRQRIKTTLFLPNGQHVFQDWKTKYAKYYDSIAARTPGGEKQRKKLDKKDNGKYTKFRINDPLFRKLIIQEFETQGKPKIYNISPNDGLGFDIGLEPTKPPLEVWKGKFDVTKHYLNLWTFVDSSINLKYTNTEFLTSAYKAFWKYPPGYKWDGKNFHIRYVARENDEINLKNWIETGASVYLRPNWWANRKCNFINPWYDYQADAEYMQKAKLMGIKGFAFDIFRRFWAWQGINYYLMARMGYTDKSKEEIIEEYVSSFGNLGEKYFIETEKIAKNYKPVLRGKKPTFNLEQTEDDIKTIENLIKMIDNGISKETNADIETLNRIKMLRNGLLISKKLHQIRIDKVDLNNKEVYNKLSLELNEMNEFDAINIKRALNAVKKLRKFK